MIVSLHTAKKHFWFSHVTFNYSFITLSPLLILSTALIAPINIHLLTLPYNSFFFSVNHKCRKHQTPVNFPFTGNTWDWRRIRHAFIFENWGDWCSYAGLESAEPLTLCLSGERNLEQFFVLTSNARSLQLSSVA